MAACHRCGARVTAGSRYCGQCGVFLGTARAGLRKTVTVLFAVASTGETSGDPERSARLHAEIYERIREVLQAHGATVERSVGDAVMAVFGVPVVREDDARRAVAAGLSLQRLAGSLPGAPTMRVGINTGEVLMVSSEADEELVVGDPVVVAARLQELAEPGEVLIGPQTGLMTRGLQSGPARQVVLRGRRGVVAVVPVVGLADEDTDARRGPTVGREAERHLLSAALERTVRSGICQLVTVLGEGGTGKSRLVEDVVSTTEDVFVLRGVCRGYGPDSRWPTVQTLATPAGFAGAGNADLLRALGHEHPVLLDVRALMIEMAAGVFSMSGRDHARTLSRALLAIAEIAPALLVVEDLHLADDSFLDLLTGVLARIDGCQVALVVTARPELLERRPTWGQGLRHSLGVTLRPLPEAPARRLAEHLLPEDPGGVEQLLAGAGGNPLLLEQLAKARLEGTGIGGHVAHLTVMGVLAARLDRLGPAVRRVLECAAVVGPVGRRVDLEALLGDARQDLGAALRVLRERDLLEVEEDRWSFTSELMRDAALAGLAREDRAELHSARGLVLSALGRAEVAAHHLEEASVLLRGADEVRAVGLRDQAAARYATAGLRALSGDLTAACDLLAKATALLPEDGYRRITLLLELGRGLHLAGELERAEAVLTEALQRCRRLGLVEAESHARLSLLDLGCVIDPERAYAEIPAVLAQVLPALEAADDDVGLAQAYRLQAATLQHGVHRAAMLEPLERSLHHAARSGDHRLVELAESMMVHSLYYGPMPLVDAAERLQQMQDRPGISRWHRAGIQARMAGVLAMQGDPEKGWDVLLEARATYRALGRARAGLLTVLIGGPIRLLANRPDQAAADLRVGVEALRHDRDLAFLPTAAGLLGEASWWLDDLDQVRAAIELTRRTAGRDDAVAQVRWRALQAKLDAVEGDSLSALRHAGEAVQLAAGTDALVLQGDAFVDAAEVRALLGDRPAAEVLLAEGIARFDLKGATRSAAIARSRLAVRGLAAVPGAS